MTTPVDRELREFSDQSLVSAESYLRGVRKAIDGVPPGKAHGTRSPAASDTTQSPPFDQLGTARRSAKRSAIEVLVGVAQATLAGLCFLFFAFMFAALVTIYPGNASPQVQWWQTLLLLLFWFILLVTFMLLTRKLWMPYTGRWSVEWNQSLERKALLAQLQQLQRKQEIDQIRKTLELNGASLDEPVSRRLGYWRVRSDRSK